jgi:hypothetical protein
MRALFGTFLFNLQILLDTFNCYIGLGIREQVLRQDEQILQLKSSSSCANVLIVQKIRPLASYGYNEGRNSLDKLPRSFSKYSGLNNHDSNETFRHSAEQC